MRIRTMSSFPLHEAARNAVLPSLSALSMSHFLCSISNRTTSVWPPQAADLNGLHPSAVKVIRIDCVRK